MLSGNKIEEGESPQWTDLLVCAYCGHEMQDERTYYDWGEERDDSPDSPYDTAESWGSCDCPKCGGQNEVRIRTQFTTRRLDQLPWLKKPSTGDSDR